MVLGELGWDGHVPKSMNGGMNRCYLGQTSFFAPFSDQCRQESYDMQSCYVGRMSASYS